MISYSARLELWKVKGGSTFHHNEIHLLTYVSIFRKCKVVAFIEVLIPGNSQLGRLKTFGFKKISETEINVSVLNPSWSFPPVCVSNHTQYTDKAWNNVAILCLTYICLLQDLPNVLGRHRQNFSPYGYLVSTMCLFVLTCSLLQTEDCKTKSAGGIKRRTFKTHGHGLLSMNELDEHSHGCFHSHSHTLHHSHQWGIYFYAQIHDMLQLCTWYTLCKSFQCYKDYKHY